MSNIAEVIKSELEIKEIPLDLILIDEEFNCRGFIATSEVTDLAADIIANGLHSPITVQPWDKIDGKQFRCIAGHRRLTAYRYNRSEGKPKSERIQAIVREHLTEEQAIILNLSENVQRTDLNPVVEARALKKLKDLGYTQQKAALALKKTRPWVQARYYILEFPLDVQNEIEKGVIRVRDVIELYALLIDPTEGLDAVYEHVRKAKNAALNDIEGRIRVKVKKKSTVATLLRAKARDKTEVESLLEHMMTYGPPGFHTRVLAWASGNITTVAILGDFKAFLATMGRVYIIPENGIRGL